MPMQLSTPMRVPGRFKSCSPWSASTSIWRRASRGGWCRRRTCNLRNDAGIGNVQPYQRVEELSGSLMSWPLPPESQGICLSVNGACLDGLHGARDATRSSLSCSERVGHWLTLPPSGGWHAIREPTGLAPLKKEKARQVVRRDQRVYLTEPKFRNHKGSKLSSLW